MPQIVDADVFQAGLLAQSIPDLPNRGVGQACFPVDEHMRERALGIQLVQDTDGAVIQRHGAHLA